VVSPSKDFAGRVLEAVERETESQVGPMLVRVDREWL
jgi:hypothetical protein